MPRAAPIRSPRSGGPGPPTIAGGIRRPDEHAEREADGDDRDHADDDELEAARSAPGLHHEQHERHRAGDEAAPQQRDAEQQVERDRAADHLGDVGRHGDELGLQPVRAARPPVADAAAERLGEALPGDDAELGREVLDEPRHHVAEDDDPDEQVAVAGAGGHVAGDVAGVEVGDARDERRPDQPGEMPGRGRRR